MLANRATHLALNALLRNWIVAESEGVISLNWTAGRKILQVIKTLSARCAIARICSRVYGARSAAHWARNADCSVESSVNRANLNANLAVKLESW